jgi:DNA-binding MarR family transcriptional regulator
MGRIYGEIRQTRPFGTTAQEAVVALLRTAEVLRARLELSLKPWGLSVEQYNVLRILRGAPGRSLPTLEVSSRMISRSPNITRLVDKLIAKGFVARSRGRSDRRVIVLRLTPRGLAQVNAASPAVDCPDVHLGSRLPRRRLAALIAALDAIRAA